MEIMLKYDHFRGTEGAGRITYRLKPRETDFDEGNWKNLAEDRVRYYEGMDKLHVLKYGALQLVSCRNVSVLY
jgi:hypothetical protein